MQHPLRTLTLKWGVLCFQRQVSTLRSQKRNIKNNNTISMYREITVVTSKGSEIETYRHTVFKVWKLMTDEVGWICSWEILKDTTSLTPPCLVVNDALFPAKGFNPIDTCKLSKITTQYRCTVRIWSSYGTKAAVLISEYTERGSFGYTASNIWHKQAHNIIIGDIGYCDILHAFDSQMKRYYVFRERFYRFRPMGSKL